MNMKLQAATLAVIFMLTGCGSAQSVAVDTAEIPQEVPTPKAELYIKETIQPVEISGTEETESDVPNEGEAEAVEGHADDIYESVEEEVPVEEVEEIEEDPHLEDIALEEEEEIIEESEVEAPIMSSSEDKTYYGACTITHYCSCSQCCGEWAGGPTASGVMPQAGVTVASDLPFGTQIEINGQRYIVQDRGVGGMWIDVYCGSHDEAMNRGMYTADVYIISG